MRAAVVGARAKGAKTVVTVTVNPASAAEASAVMLADKYEQKLVRLPRGRIEPPSASAAAATGQTRGISSTARSSACRSSRWS